MLYKAHKRDEFDLCLQALILTTTRIKANEHFLTSATGMPVSLELRPSHVSVSARDDLKLEIKSTSASNYTYIASLYLLSRGYTRVQGDPAASAPSSSNAISAQKECKEGKMLRGSRPELAAFLINSVENKGSKRTNLK
jgi:hypothetical protein